MKHRNVLLAAILLLAVFLRFWGLKWGLPYDYQSEEYKIVKYALKMGSGDLNPHFFEYPTLYLYFMLFWYGVYFATGKIFGLFATTHDFALSFIKNPTPFYLMGRVSEAICGVLIVVLVYRIGKKMYSEKVGMGSALIVCGLPHFIYMSHIIKGYMGMTVLLLLFFYCCLKISEGEDPKSYLGAGILMGLAVSTRYHAAPFGIVLPLAHFYRLYYSGRRSENGEKSYGWGENRWFIFSLVLIPVFFLIGTPYAILAPREFWQDVGQNLDIYSSLSGEKTSFIHGVLTVANRFLTFGDVPAPLLLGIICAGGFVFAIFKWKPQHLLILVPILTYLGVVGRYHNPAGGYLLQIFPLFVILALQGLFSLPEKWPSVFGITVLMAGMGWNLWAGSQMAYSFTVPDTRTMAKEWIEIHIPQGSKILIDSKVQSPPLLMSYEQVEKFYHKAVELNHFKKEYFKLQMEAHPGTGQGYEIYMVKRTFREIASLEHQVAETQKLQDLLEVDGDIAKLKAAGIQYVITDHWTQDDAVRNKRLGIEDFYRNLPKQATLLKVFIPPYHIYHGGIIYIYQL